jgi:hypothetical protein
LANKKVSINLAAERGPMQRELISILISIKGWKIAKQAMSVEQDDDLPY